MKQLTINLRIALTLVVMALLWQGCLKSKYEDLEKGQEEILNVYKDFDFKTVSTKTIVVQTLDSEDVPVEGAPISLYTQNPYNASFEIDAEMEKSKIFQEFTN